MQKDAQSHGPKSGREESVVLRAIQNSIEAKEQVSRECLPDIIQVARVIGEALSASHRVVFFGNGGSAADAQHIAAELVGKFKKKRQALNVSALTTNTSVLTAIGNDFGFDEVFARQVEGSVGKGDVAVGISTSGRSPNVIKGIQAAQRVGAKTIALTGAGGGQLAPLCDHKVIVPSEDTQRIQECHIMIGHVVCELVEDMIGDATSQTE